jgi:hypothetical protein
LVAYRARRLTRGLAGCLALAAATGLDGFRQILLIDGFDVLSSHAKYHAFLLIVSDDIICFNYRQGNRSTAQALDSGLCQQACKLLRHCSEIEPSFRLPFFRLALLLFGYIPQRVCALIVPSQTKKILREI